MTTKITLFSGKEYLSKYDWETDSINAEDGTSFMKSSSFIEVFYDDYFVRGDGKTFEEAELDAWNKNTKIKNCKNHDFKRLSESGRGSCIHCNLTTDKLENLVKCKECETKALFYFGYDSVCSKHFYAGVEKIVKTRDSPEEDDTVLLKSYNTMKYLNEKNSNLSEEDLSEQLKIYGNSYSFVMDTIEQVYKDIELEELFSLADLIQTTYQYNKILLSVEDGSGELIELIKLIKELK